MSFVRGAYRDDQSYVASTWVRSATGIARRHMYESDSRSRQALALSKQIDRVLDRGDTRCLIRSAAHDKRLILGWIVHVEGAGLPLVHFLYVRNRLEDGTAVRERGVASELLHAIGARRDAGLVYTCFLTDRMREGRALRNSYRMATFMPLSEFLGPETPSEPQQKAKVA